MKLAESERRVMEVLWAEGPMPARMVAAALTEKIGWKKTTTYTMLTRCGTKNYLRRDDPDFMCTPLLSRQEVAEMETDELLRANFQGSPILLIKSLRQRGLLTSEELKALTEE